MSRVPGKNFEAVGAEFASGRKVATQGLAGDAELVAQFAEGWCRV